MEKVDDDLINLEKTPGDMDLLNRVFRSVHTVKGAASFLEFELLVKVTHKAEDVLNRLRKGELAVNNRIMDVILEAMQAARRHGTIISYDLNFRPSLWQDIGGTAKAIEVNREIARYVDVMLGNEEDFTAALGLPDRFARRIARNTQLVLLEESHLAKVADPAAGSRRPVDHQPGTDVLEQRGSEKRVTNSGGG